MKENKKEICNLFCKALQATRNGEDITSIVYEADGSGEEYAVITFNNGYCKRACISGDSGTAIMKDILYAIL